MQGLLHKGFRNNAHMIRAAARNNAYIIDVPKLLVRNMLKAEAYPSVLKPRFDRLFNDSGLLHYLLYHKMGITALFGSVHIPLDMLDLMGDALAVGIHDSHSILGKDRKLPLAQSEDVPRMLKYSRNIGCNEVFAIAQSDYQRTVLSERHYLPGIITEQYSYCIGTLQQYFGFAHRVNRISAVIVIDKL